MISARRRPGSDAVDEFKAKSAATVPVPDGGLIAWIQAVSCIEVLIRRTLKGLRELICIEGHLIMFNI